MNTWLLIGSLLLSGSNSATQWLSNLSVSEPAGDAHTLALVMSCRSENSPLLRLDCYDNALSASSNPNGGQQQAGPAWQRAMAQEKGRSDHSTAFLISEGQGSNPQVVLTTPALGMPPPRPVLMLSCIDNITRLQVALVGPQKDGAVTLTADSDRFNVQWFLRENGYLLESSRGLAGIDEIKRLMSAQTLTIDGTNGGISRLTFNISQLTTALKPLRNACHW